MILFPQEGRWDQDELKSLIPFSGNNNRDINFCNCTTKRNAPATRDMAPAEHSNACCATEIVALVYSSMFSNRLCKTSRNDVILLPLRDKSWIECNFCRPVEIIYLLLSSKRDVD